MKANGLAVYTLDRTNQESACRGDQERSLDVYPGPDKDKKIRNQTEKTGIKGLGQELIKVRELKSGWEKISPYTTERGEKNQQSQSNLNRDGATAAASQSATITKCKENTT